MLPDDAAARGPEGHPHRHLAAPQGRPCGEKVRHVDARDEEDADAGAEHREQQVVDLRREHAARVADDLHAKPGIRLRELRFELRGDGGKLGLRLRDARPLLELSEDTDERLLASRRLRIDRERNPHRFADREAEGRRHDADNGPVRAVHTQHPADDVRSAAESLAPHGIPQEHHGLRAGTIVSHLEPAAQFRLNGERFEGLDGQQAAGKPLRASVFRRHVQRRVAVRAELLKRCLPRRVNREVVNAEGQFALVLRRPRAPDRHDPVRIRKWESLEEPPVDDAKDGGAQADPKAERQNRPQRQRRVLDQHADAGAEVGEKLGHAL